MMTKIYLCPSDKKYGCSWEGSSEDILEHFMQEHEDLLSYTNSVDVNLEVSSENYLIFADTEIYLLQTKITHNQLCIFLRYLGPVKIAAKITYDINITRGEEKLEKSNITIKDGSFTINLECLKEMFEDVHTVSCQLLISGDFKSHSSDDNVFLEEDIHLSENLKRKIFSSNIHNNDSLDKEDNFNLPHLGLRLDLERKYSLESSEPTTPSLEELFFLSKDTLTPDKQKKSRPKSLIDDVNRSKWYTETDNINADEETSRTEHSSLQRSSTFGSDDIKKRNIPKRNCSVRSLHAIKENDPELELKCLNCDSHLAPPIFLCEFSHNICSNCYRTRDKCTECDSKITADRNLKLEQKSVEYIYTCKNKRNGCPQKLSYKEIGEHEINCTFCSYHCPMDQCGYKGPYKNILSHLNLIHSSVKLFESFIAVFQKHTEVFLANEKMGIFYCTLKIIEDVVVWKARFCGPKERKFFCELKFKGKDFKFPILLTRIDDCYIKEIPTSELKEQKIKSKNSILTITR